MTRFIARGLAMPCSLGGALVSAETKASKSKIIVISTDDHGCMGIMKSVKTLEPKKVFQRSSPQKQIPASGET